MSGNPHNSSRRARHFPRGELHAFLLEGSADSHDLSPKGEIIVGERRRDAMLQDPVGAVRNLEDNLSRDVLELSDAGERLEGEAKDVHRSLAA